jgi:hypothetical protein
MEMFMDMQYIESTDRNGLRHRMEWALAEDVLAA